MKLSFILYYFPFLWWGDCFTVLWSTFCFKNLGMHCCQQHRKISVALLGSGIIQEETLDSLLSVGFAVSAMDLLKITSHSNFTSSGPGITSSLRASCHYSYCFQPSTFWFQLMCCNSMYLCSTIVFIFWLSRCVAIIKGNFYPFVNRENKIRNIKLYHTAIYKREITRLGSTGCFFETYVFPLFLFYWKSENYTFAGSLSTEIKVGEMQELKKQEQPVWKSCAGSHGECVPGD